MNTDWWHDLAGWVSGTHRFAMTVFPVDDDSVDNLPHMAEGERWRHRGGSRHRGDKANADDVQDSLDGRTIITEQWACSAQCPLTDPRVIPSNPPWPRLPSTSRSAWRVPP